MSIKNLEKILFGMALFALIVMLPINASAAGTSSGATIRNRASVSWVVAGSNLDSTTSAVDTTVGKISSDTLSAEADQIAAVGETKTFTYLFYNSANRTDTFNIWVDSFSLNGGAASWTFTLTVNNQTTSTTNDTKVSLAIGADAEASCSVAIWVNSTPANSPNGSFADFRLQISPGNIIGADTTQQYTGDNGNTYAYGNAGSNDIARTTVQAAIMAVLKSVSSITLNGNPSLPLPGASITYELTYNNIGSAEAESVVLRDTIPSNTTFDTMSRSGAAFGGSATFVTDTGANGWLAQVTTAANPSFAFYSTDWTNAHNWDGTGTITYVRWIRQSVASAETKTMRFRVFIQ